MTNTVDLATSVDELMATLIASAQKLAEKQAKSLAGFDQEWAALYASIPEGRLRAMAESSQVQIGAQEAANRNRDGANILSNITALIAAVEDEKRADAERSAAEAAEEEVGEHV